MKARPISEKLFTQAQKYIPGGVNSPVRSFRSVVGKPLYLKRGIGPYVEDEDGNRLIDFCGSWGPLIHGHAPENVVHAIAKTAADGTSFGTPHRHEVEIAELICERIPWVEKIRFVSSGTEAVMSAIRLARAYTERPLLLKFEGCYHGHVDSLLVKAGSGLLTFGNSSSSGVPPEFVQNTLVVNLNDETALMKAFQEHGPRIAAAIIEPIPANAGLLIQRRDFLVKLRELTRAHGALLVFDEVISGFRFGFQGASGFYKIEPDLVTYGKIIGGGLPVGAFGGKKEIMGLLAPEGSVYQAGTLSGNPLSLVAGLTSLKMCLQPGFYDSLKKRVKERFIRPIARETAKRSWPLKLPYSGSVFWFLMGGGRIPRALHDVNADGAKMFREFHRNALDAGVYLPPSHYEVGFISSAHTETVLEQAADILIRELHGFFQKHL